LGEGVTPIRPDTPKGQQPPRPTVADFEAVIDQHIEGVKAGWDPDLVALFDAERAAAAEVWNEHRRRLDALRLRAERRQVQLPDVLRYL
jgi:hypothetical protein